MVETYMWKYDNTNIQVYFNLTFYNDFDVYSLSSILGIEPTRCYSKKDTIKKNPEKPFSDWQIGTGYVETIFLEDLTEILCDKLEGKEEKIKDIINNNDCLAYVSIVPVIHNNAAPVLTYNKRFINLLHKLGVETDTDMYIV